MNRSRRKFTSDFKLRAVELSYTRSSIAELATELEIRPVRQQGGGQTWFLHLPALGTGLPAHS